MSNISCDACTDLREYAPNFVHNGTDSTVCGSLMNNNGLNPSLTTLHDNCEDLHNVNDCLIGRMTDELEAYDVCDWKEFMRKHNSNLYELLKAMICSDCGQWNKIESLCAMVSQLLYPDVTVYGVRSPDYMSEHPGAVVTGHIYSKGGMPVVRPMTLSEHGSAAGYTPSCGVSFSWTEMEDCDTGARVALMQYCPHFYQYYSTAALNVNDIVWYATRSELVAQMGAIPGRSLIANFIGGSGGSAYASSWSWNGGAYTGSNRKRWWWRMSVDIGGVELGTGEDTVYIQYMGTDEPNPLFPPGDGVEIMGYNDDSSLRRILYRL